MTTAKPAQNPRTDTELARDSKAQPSRKKSLQELYARLEKTQDGSEESKRIAAKIVDAIG